MRGLVGAAAPFSLGGSAMLGRGEAEVLTSRLFCAQNEEADVAPLMFAVNKREFGGCVPETVRVWGKIQVRIGAVKWSGMELR